MPAFLETLFGRKKPTTVTVRAELAKVEAALEAAPRRVERAKAVLQRVADLSDAEHEAAIAELGAAERAVVRLNAQAADLAIALDGAEKAEAAAERRACAEAARKRMAGMEKLLDRFDEQAAALATTAKEIEAIEAEVAAANYKNETARRAGLEAAEPVPTSQELFRTEPDTVVPDREVVEKIWRRMGASGRWQNVCVFVERDGKMVPNELGAELHEVRRTIPGETRRGRLMESPLMYLTLPATRLGGKGHWSRRA